MQCLQAKHNHKLVKRDLGVFNFSSFKDNFFTWDDVVSQRHKFGSAFLSCNYIFLGSQELPCFFNFPVSYAHPEKLCDFYWLQL